MALFNDRFILWLHRVTNLELPEPTVPDEVAPAIADADLEQVTNKLVSDTLAGASAGPIATAKVGVIRSVMRLLKALNPDDAYHRLGRREVVDVATHLTAHTPTDLELSTGLAEMKVIDAALRYLGGTPSASDEHREGLGSCDLIVLSCDNVTELAQISVEGALCKR